jgi:P27 family predicted phage terminase small subunit
MKPGPPPVPVELKVLHGNPGHRPLKVPRAKPAPGADCPVWLSRPAKRQWKQIAPTLQKLGLLTEIDPAALACLCEAIADLKWAIATIRRTGRLTETGNGTMVVHPAAVIKRQALEQIRKFSAEFGLTPATRTRVELSDAENPSEVEGRFFGPRAAPAPKKKRA